MCWRELISAPPVREGPGNTQTCGSETADTSGVPSNGRTKPEMRPTSPLPPLPSTSGGAEHAASPKAERPPTWSSAAAARTAASVIQGTSCECLRRAGASWQGFAGIIRAMFTSREPFYARFGYARPGGVVDGRKLWTSGAVTAVIVFGLTIAAFLFVHGMLNYPLLGVRGDDAVVYASMFGYAGGAALVALLATAAMRFLLLTTPRPRWFFGWLGGVGTAIAVLLPLALSQDQATRLATATVNLVLGLAIIGLVRSTSASLRPDGSAELPQTFRTLDEG